MLFAALYQWVVLAAVVSPSLAKLYTNPSQLTKTNYDYIVIGGKLPRHCGVSLV